MILRHLKDNSGMALMLTILIISLIVALTIQFNKSMRSTLIAAANLRDGVKLGCIARSGFSGALAMLYKDGSAGDVDTLHEDWATLKITSVASSSLFEEGRFNIEITDLAGKIQINQLIDSNGDYSNIQKEILTRFLSLPEFELESEKVDNIVDAIKDWIDSDNETTKFGAENSYYQTLDKPYSCKNGPIDFIEELLYVKEVTKELFYGSEENPGIAPYLSSYGDGKININTADALVIRALSEQIEKELAENIISYREDEDNDLSGSNWYKKAAGTSHVTIDSALLTTSSNFFEITSDGILDAMSKRILSVVKREDKKIRILSWKTE